MPLLSIVIPTYRRAKTLTKTLDRLAAQTIVRDLEVIVVSDGHDTETAELFREMPETKSQKPSRWPFALQFIEIPKSQQGTARNEGMKHATAARVLFIGDDIFLQPDACAYHATDKSAAVLGFTTWDPELIITPLMRWLETSGWQFGYPKIAAYAGRELPTEMQDRFTYTSHVSVPLCVAKNFPFRENLTLYGWEDIEWGMRLRDAGVRVVYEPRAKAFHHHPMAIQDSLKRMEILGRSAVAFEKTDPRMKIVPKGLKRIAYEVLSHLPTLAGRHRRAFLRGIRGL